MERIAAAEAGAHEGYGQGGESARFGPLVAVFAGEGSPLSAAWHDGTGEPSEADWADFEAFGRGHGLKPTLHLLSLAAPALLPVLAARGYTLTTLIHLWTHELRDLPPAPGLEVTGEPDPDAWAALSAQGFGPGSEAVMRAVARHPDARRFVARVDGQPAGSAGMSVHDGVAAFYGTSTHPEFRGRGAQTALLAYRLHAAAQAGADLATVFTTPGTPSERNVRRAGFVMTGARLTFTQG